MKSVSFSIPGRLPGMNDFIGAMNANRWKGADLKKKETKRCALAVIGMPRMNKPVNLEIKWIERDARRDIDNISGGGTKVLLDGLVSAGVLEDDSRRWVRSIVNHFPEPDKANPRVEVLLIELDDGATRP